MSFIPLSEDNHYTTTRQRTSYSLPYAVLKSDPDENRTRVSAVKGRCLSRLTTGPKKWIMESGKWKVYQDHHTTISEILW